MKNEEGQSTVEFALTLTLLMSFTFFFVRLSLAMAYGNLVQYATFLSARAYQAAGPDQNDQKERAKQVLVRLLKKSEGQAGTERFPMIAKAFGGGELTGAEIGPGGQYVADDFDFSWQEGVRYSFRSKLFVSLFGRSAKPDGQTGGEPNELKLTSESWLGREPTEEECMQTLGKASGGALLIDNGC